MIRGRRVAVDVAVAVLVGLLAWRESTLVPQPGLDRSWVTALHLLAGTDLRWGHDVIFTYGPLGYLAFPALTQTWSALGFVVFQVGTAAGLAYVLAQGWSRCLPRWAAWLVAGLVVNVIPPSIDLVALLPLGLVAAVLADPSRWPTKRVLPVVALASGATALLSLVKFSAGILASALVGAAAVAAFGRRAVWRYAVPPVAYLVVGGAAVRAGPGLPLPAGPGQRGVGPLRGPRRHHLRTSPSGRAPHRPAGRHGDGAGPRSGDPRRRAGRVPRFPG